MNNEKELKEKINKLNEVLKNLNNLVYDNDNSKIKDQIDLIKEQIIDYELELNNVNSYIPFKKRFINNFLKSKTVILNLLLIIFELLNIFTDIFKDSDNELFRVIALTIPALTIYLRTFQK